MDNPDIQESLKIIPTSGNNSVNNEAITTMANSEVSPQINTVFEVQSAQDFRSTVSQVEQLEHQGNEVFSDMPQTPLHVANENQTVPPKPLEGSREVKDLGSVNSAGRKESLACSDSGRTKPPTFDAAKINCEYALL